MSQAFVFPGQGSQFIRMGKNLYDGNVQAKLLFEQANEIMGFPISDVMFFGTAEELTQTNVTQPAVFLHSVIAYKTLATSKPDMVAGHSLGEFTALVANECLSFEEALVLVSIRAKAMQRACELNPSTMAAILGMEDQKVTDICSLITNEVVVAANFNCPGQVVISGSKQGIEEACLLLKEAGARRAIVLPVGGAFHSPLMQPAKDELSGAIEKTIFKVPFCPVYQNVVGSAVSDPGMIKANLVSQLTGPVKWTQTIQQMIADGADSFTECGPGKVLQGLVAKINREVAVNGIG